MRHGRNTRQAALAATRQCCTRPPATRAAQALGPSWPPHRGLVGDPRVDGRPQVGGDVLQAHPALNRSLIRDLQINADRMAFRAPWPAIVWRQGKAGSQQPQPGRRRPGAGWDPCSATGGPTCSAEPRQQRCRGCGLASSQGGQCPGCVLAPPRLRAALEAYKVVIRCGCRGARAAAVLFAQAPCRRCAGAGGGS